MFASDRLRHGMIRAHALLALLALATSAAPAAAQDLVFDQEAWRGLEYRCLGPWRGGRSAAVTGIPGDPLTYYFGACGGGVWKSVDGGRSWRNVSDGFFGGSIGAVAVSAWDPNVIYVGGGEKTVRGNVSHGDGVWRSVDAGRTWTHVGLEDSRHVCRIRIHPRDADVAYAAVLGHLFGPSEERGIYRTRDGGATWERVLFVSPDAGAVDLEMDPTNPRLLYASFWRVRRTPYSLESGGEGSGLWRSSDGGDTWTEITRNEGLPRGTVGINAAAVSPARPERVWALIEAEDGGLFRSDDAGETWSRVNDERKLRQRAWYYTRLYADTRDEDTVYVLNVSFWRSKDGGRTFDEIDTPHSDHHDLWIAPGDPRQMIIGDDGGAQVTLDGGENWSTYHNQPTAQFYRVTTDDAFPYRVYGAQQDNSPVRIRHRSDGRGITEFDWEPTAGGESGWIAPDPKNPDVVYGGSYGGFLVRQDHATGETRAVNVWPDNPMGHGAEGMNPRFQWNFPLLFSRHDPYVLYAAGNILFMTQNEGQRWIAMSGDLTRADPATLGPSGGPITKDNTGVEYYGTIFAVAEDAHAPGVIWCGSDDGLIHVTRDSGATWENVTPPERLLPAWAQINCLEADPFLTGGLYAAATRYKSDDFAPYLLRTRDFGATWERIDEGIPADHFTRVVRADPARRGLLYAGTERGMHVSFDDGRSWRSFQLNLPVVPITDLAVKGDDLVVATQGRSFWILDDLSPLRVLDAGIAARETWLFTPRPSYRLTGSGRWSTSGAVGENLPEGVLIRYRVPAAPDSAAWRLEILEEDGEVIRAYTPGAEKERDRLPLEPGLEQLVWNLRYPDAETFEGMILWAGQTRGPKAVPGRYGARLVAGADTLEAAFEVLLDPRSTATVEDLRTQFGFLMELRDRLTGAHRAIIRLRDVRDQVRALLDRLPDDEALAPVREAGAALADTLTRIEETLYQTRSRSPQDPLNYPIRLNNKLAALAGTTGLGDFEPTLQDLAVRDELAGRIDAELGKLAAVLAGELARFNALVRERAVPAVIVPADD